MWTPWLESIIQNSFGSGVPLRSTCTRSVVEVDPRVGYRLFWYTHLLENLLVLELEVPEISEVSKNPEVESGVHSTSYLYDKRDTRQVQGLDVLDTHVIDQQNTVIQNPIK